MKTYFGKVLTVGSGGHPVYVAQGISPELTLLSPRYDLANHSAGGFAWGYSGSGPAQLAIALLADALGDDARAVNLYQVFKLTFVSKLPMDDPWAISDVDVIRLAGELEVLFCMGGRT